MSSIPTGKHILTGICEINVACGYDGEDTTDGLCLTIDGKNYIAYSDPDDGYRSYGCFYQNDNYDQKNPFPYQDVIVENHQWDEVDMDGFEQRGDEIVIYNADDHSEIFRCGTNRSDDYYPCGYWHYHPENLPINKQKKREDDNKRFEDALNTMYDVFGVARPVVDEPEAEETEECRIPSQKEPDVDYECLEFEPGPDNDIDDGYDDYCKACSFLKHVKMDATFWQCFEHLVRDSVKRKFENWLENEFEKHDTDELLSLWEEFSKNFKN